jgi:hypothetical protein
MRRERLQQVAAGYWVLSPLSCPRPRSPPRRDRVTLLTVQVCQRCDGLAEATAWQPPLTRTLVVSAHRCAVASLQNVMKHSANRTAFYKVSVLPTSHIAELMLACRGLNA